MLLGGLKPVTQRVVVTPFKPAFLALALTRPDQVLEAPRPLGSRFATLGAPLIPLHPELVLALPGDRQVRELVLYRSSHLSSFATALNI